MTEAAGLPGGIGAELRRARRTQGLTQPELAARSKVSQTVISEIENGRRAPSLRTYERLRAALGLAAPASVLVRRPVAAPDLSEAVRSRLAAVLVAGRGGALVDIGEAVGTSAAAVREALPLLAERLAAVGYQLVEDGMSVRLAPLAHVAGAVEHVTRVEMSETPSPEQLTVLLLIAHRGQATRRAVEAVVGDDCETILARLIARDFLSATRDDTQPRSPNLYRLTAKALAACGHPSLESLQGYLAEVAGPDLAMRLRTMASG